MFDHKPTDGAYFNAMIANRNIGNANADLANRNAQIARENNENARQWMERAQAFEAELAKTKALLENKLMSEAGFRASQKALKDALRISAPRHPLISDSGKRYKDGDIKDGASLIYMQAFDAKGRELRIENPEKRRAD
jgi:hypothetical protein